MSQPPSPPSDAPGDDADAGMEGDLGQLSDADWLRAHRALIASGDIPESELGYLYDPDRDPADVSVDELTVDRDPKEASDG